MQAQMLLSEDFENGSLPSGWTVESNASDGGWLVTTPGNLSGQIWTVFDNGSQRVAGTSDNKCNCDKSADYLILPTLDFTNISGAVLRFDAYYSGGIFGTFAEEAAVEASTNGGVNWTTIHEMQGAGGWPTITVDLEQFSGESAVTFRFFYTDDGGHVFGFAIDNVVVEVPSQLDAGLTDLTAPPFAEEQTPIAIKGTFKNNGLNTINSIEITYTPEGGSATSGTIDGLNIQTLDSYEFEHPTPWGADITGDVTVTVEITAVNGTSDEISDNNTLEFDIEIFPLVTPPNRIQEYLLTNPQFVEVANASDQLDKPTDLDFYPILSKNELWVINERVENSGGSTVTFFDAGKANQTTWQRVDGNAWHFMSLPTAMEFGDNFNWASAPGIQDANHAGGSFTGPTLWSSDPAIYAQPSGGNGSHLDMLHGSPYSMGIAHEVDNVYWINDTWHEEIVRYDFVDDHGPGNSYHGDALVRRYQEIKTRRDGNVPSHMLLDKSTGWMYVVDNGNDRVLRLDINSGNVTNNLPLINEQLTEHSRVGNVDWEVIIDSGLDRPCGIEIMENRLLVSDYANGDIIVYDMDDNFSELGRIHTEVPGITGLKIGPEGYIWYTNRSQNTLTKVEPGDPLNAEEALWEASIKVFPNPASDRIQVYLTELPTHNVLTLELTDLMGKKVWAGKSISNTTAIEVSNFTAGTYLLTISNEAFVVTRRVVVD